MKLLTAKTTDRPQEGYFTPKPALYRPKIATVNNTPITQGNPVQLNLNNRTQGR